MADVYTFKPREPEPEPTIVGQARCMDCKHEWTAMVTVDHHQATEGWLECSCCGMRRARLKNPYSPPDDVPIWRCKCGSDIFNVLIDQVFCPACGTYQKLPK